MWFKHRSENRLLRLVAALTLAAISIWILGDFPFLGWSLIVTGLAIAFYQGIQMARERRDKYDLSRLWIEKMPEEPEEDNKLRDMTYCHRCGASMPQKHSICPQCGNFLGT